LGNLRLLLGFILLSRKDLKVTQYIVPWVRVGLFGLFGGIMLIVRRTDEWSDQRSSKLVIILWRFFGILFKNMSRISGFFLGRWASMFMAAEHVFYNYVIPLKCYWYFCECYLCGSPIVYFKHLCRLRLCIFVQRSW